MKTSIYQSDLQCPGDVHFPFTQDGLQTGVSQCLPSKPETHLFDIIISLNLILDL